MKKLEKQFEGIINDLILNYKAKGQYITGIEFSCSPNQLNTLRIGYFDVKKNSLVDESAVLAIKF